MICLVLGFGRKKSLWFSLGGIAPDFDYMVSFILTGSMYALHRYLFHNVFFLLFSAIVGLFQPLFAVGVYSHFGLDIVASEFGTMLYPFADVEIGLAQAWLYSTEVNVFVSGLFILVVILKERYILEKTDKADILRFLTMSLGCFSFLSDTLKFLGVFFLMFGFFVDDEYIRRVWYAVKS